jgi:hypothetical protein
MAASALPSSNPMFTSCSSCPAPRRGGDGRDELAEVEAAAAAGEDEDEGEPEVGDAAGGAVAAPEEAARGRAVGGGGGGGAGDELGDMRLGKVGRRAREEGEAADDEAEEDEAEEAAEEEANGASDICEAEVRLAI